MTMRMMTSMLARALAAAAFVLVWCGPASAAPHRARITAVFRTSDCAANECDPDRDPKLKEGSLSGGIVQVHVAAEADLGLEWVRLEAQMPGDPRWYCIEFWNAERATSFENFRTWHTTNWTDPREECKQEHCSGCQENSPHYHGAPTSNVTHSMRVVAREQGGTVSGVADDTSDTFAIKIQNAPVSPSWAAQPTSSGSDQGRPAVDLQWAPSPEPDVLEYRFVRMDPSGNRTAYAVSARTPEDQGCARISNAAYRCKDTNFPRAGFGGTYRYAVQSARRAVQGEKCELSADRCVVGELSDARAVEVADGPPAPAQSGAGPGPGPTASGDGSRPPAPVALDTAPPLPDDVLPESRGSRVWLLAGGLLLAFAAGILAWASVRHRRAAEG